MKKVDFLNYIKFWRGSVKKDRLLYYNFTRKQQTVINMLSSVIALAISMGISFFLSPYIVKTLGADANGYVNLANNFIGYTNLITVALNSMANRFISIEYHRGNIKKANKYYSSLFYGDLFIVIILSIVSFVVVDNIENFLQVSTELVLSVKVLFSILFVNSLVNTLFTIWNCSTYIVNRLYLSSLRTIQSNILRAIVIVMMFSMFKPSIIYLGLGTVAASTLTNIYNCYYKKVLISDLRVERRNFDWKATKDLISSGIWNSLSNASNILLTGIDLLITNIFIDASSMGMLSVAKIIPSVISEFSGTITNVFTPTLVIDFAKEEKDKIYNSLIQASKITSIICIIPLAYLICFGDIFYSFWQPTLDSRELQILSILTCMMLAVTAGLQVFYNVFMVTNKVKESSIVIFCFAVLSTVVTGVLVRYTNLGVYAVAGVSSIVIIIRNLVYTVPYSAKYLGLPKNSFFGIAIKSVFSTILSCGVGGFFRFAFNINGWISLILVAVGYAIIAFLVNFMIVLSNEEKTVLQGAIENIIRGRKD